VLLGGCWVAPVATVQPKGPPRVIEKGVVVESVLSPATVQSVDPRTRVIVMQAGGDAQPHAYRAGVKLPGFDRVTARDKVRATVTQELTVYVSKDGRSPDLDGGPATRVPDAKVLSVDTSYRLLTLQYPNGRTETYKVGLEVKLKEMVAGDDVMIQPLEIVSLKLRKS
jgi:hypothetical protein